MTRRRSDTVNRVLWTVLGLVLAAGGIAGALASTGHLSGTDPDSPVLWSWAIETWRDAGTAAPAVTAALGALVGLLGYLLLRAQLPRRSSVPGNIFLSAPEDRGVTKLRGGAVPGALAADLRQIEVVRDSHVTLSGPSEATAVRVRLDVLPDTTVSRLAVQVQHCLDRFTTTTGVHVADVEVTLRLDEPIPRPRVD